MRKVVVTEYVTLDGVMEAPNTWSFQFWTPEAAQYKFDELFASDALLLGRVTYQGFAGAWPTVKDEQGFADRMNGIPKYVVSTTLQNAEWNNSHIISENVADEISRLKQEEGQDILVAGSGQLLQTLMENDLVDEYRLMVHPIVVGSGKHLFGEGNPMSAMKLVDTKVFDSGIVALTYEPDRSKAK